MNEVEKLYRNAHVYPRVYGDITKETFENKVLNMADMCNEAFTAEKQIEILKFLFAKDVFKCYQHYTSKAYIVLRDNARDFICNKPFNEFLASYINCIWQSLTDKEKQQVKGILEWVNTL